ncbi:MAG: superoxide dismutase family protein [Chloroflexia bacterium]
MYLLDTNVVSGLRKPRCDENVRRWIAQCEPTQCFLSVVVPMELEYGVCLVERRDERQGRTLRAWLQEAVLPGFAGRVIDLTQPSARRCAAMQAKRPAGLAQSSTAGAKAELKNAQGQSIGTAIFSPEAGGVKLQVQVRGFAAAAAGEHGIHVHTTGKCEADAFTTAGGHFNPGGKKHGLNSPEGHHAGDMPNITFDASGNAAYEMILDGVTISDGPTALLDADGSALVIHAGPDDLVTDPSGNSGARVVCGELAAYAITLAGMPQTGVGIDSNLVIVVGLLGALALVLLGGRMAAKRR